VSGAFTVAAYYFPNYHPDPRNAEEHGAGWTEWEVLQAARPRYTGHRQPRIPAWGYEDESQPSVMERKIDAALQHGVDVFLYDWYWYEDGPFLERGLEQGFLGARNADRMRFAIHWANHDWLDLHPASRRDCAHRSQRILYPGTLTPQGFERMIAHVIQRYFRHPSYWRIDDAPYFSFYDLGSLLKSCGGVEGTAQALARFREAARQAGIPRLHLNQVLWNQGVLPRETGVQNADALLKRLGFDSFTSYVWVHHVALDRFPEVDYLQALRAYQEYWKDAVRTASLPYFPNLTMGWDSSPRTVQSDRFENVGYPFTPILAGNTPQRFGEAMRAVLDQMRAGGSPRILTVNAWNEWTEGSYLEPDTQYGMGYLEAIRDALR